MSAEEDCFAGRMRSVVALVDVGHVVLWDLGPLATGASPRGLLQLAVLIRRLRKLPLRGA